MLGEHLNSEESRGLLLAIDKMREILHGEKITLPEIVVVGDQSVGKSSVLEAISGIQLPRAQNICTRCPLELRMKTAHDKEYATIRSGVSCTTDKLIDDLSKIADEVTRLTSEIAGKGANVSPDPIYLTVFKRDILYDLTLIDLPGITRNPLPGQAENIHEQILQLINKYIEPPTAIVLHVIPASVDFTTSESMKLAKVFDPTCQRQLIAASKIDKYDKGIAEKLQGRGLGSMELQLGCVAVLNRNQHEIDDNVSFDDMKQREKEFFRHHKDAFQHLPEEFKGSEQLVRRLATIQQERIRSTFPDIIKELRKQLTEKKAQLKKIPLSMNTEHECWTSFQSMINAYRESIHDKVKGEYGQVSSIEITSLPTTCTDLEDESSIDIDPDIATDEPEEELEITGESKKDHIAYHIYQLQRTFQKECQNSFTNFFSRQYYKIILREIDQTAGVSLPNFPSYQIVVGLFRNELNKLPGCCDKLVAEIHQYMSECLLRLFEHAFINDFPRLKERLKEVIIKQLNEVKDTLLERVQEILGTEHHVFTLNHYYMDTVNKLKEKVKDKSNDQKGSSSAKSWASTVVTNSTEAVTYAPMSNEAQAAVGIQIALHAYSKVVQKRLIDNIAQTCYYHFITQCALKIDQLLSASIPSSQLLQYMREPHRQTTLRNKLTCSIQACEHALQLGLEHM
ncbi:unnamed protein product [Rotaria magnacalcarata]|uniref:Uncharacterized protein n=2 Tax=Rotaria magnacalcarata TaxID=392030 RepID=A0A816BXS0_9BILA|nr:unnamed protein product [Rotaria magnacalcarata]CAF1614631.1 unnamed protein product [Rotaria magnacalcarata]CAF3834578.1 unnamed protein product [Rotaria magnacalcarata]CAF3970727.1 unnamed protein product [Rotaria magnacalcarata]